MPTEAEIEGARLQEGGHVVVFPFPASGHIAPFIPFARSLASCGVAVTFVYPTNEFDRVKLLVEDESFDARGNVKLLAFEVPREYVWNADVFDELKQFMYANVEEFDGMVGRLMGEARAIQYPRPCEGGPPLCIVSDMFLGFTQGTAEKFHIQRYCLFSSPIHFLSFLFHLPKFTAEGLIPLSQHSSPVRIPNFPPILPHDLPPSQQADIGDPDSYKFLLNEANQLYKAAGVLVNSVEELEQETFRGLLQCGNDIVPGRKLPKILTIGPLLEGLGGDGLLSLRPPPASASAIFAWLNQQAVSSVLYICFGTVALVSPSQLREIAEALDASPCRFLWVIRLPPTPTTPVPVPVPASASASFFPEGFQERTRSRGLLHFDWAPQLHILAHPAVRAFVSHCGWNSAVESLVAGVPLVAWPYQAEQMMNATLLEDGLGVAVRVNKEGGGSWYGETVSRESLGQAVTMVMGEAEEEGEGMQRRAADVRGVMASAGRRGGGGLSRTNLETFVTEVRTLAKRTKGA